MQKSQAYGQRLLRARPRPTSGCRHASRRMVRKNPVGPWSCTAAGGASLSATPIRIPRSLPPSCSTSSRRTRYRVVRGGAPSGPVLRTTAAFPRSLRHSAHLVQRLPPVTEAISRLLRRAQSEADWHAINGLYQSRGMMPVDPERCTPREQGGPVYWLAEDDTSGQIIGSVMGIDHHRAFNDPENGSSLWCLAVSPSCPRPGVGEALVRHLIEHYMGRGLAYLDLSVLHDNQQAKALYAKLGFRDLQTFTVKRKNSFNQPLFLGPGPEAKLNPYAKIIVDEARRRHRDRGQRCRGRTVHAHPGWSAGALPGVAVRSHLGREHDALPGQAPDPPHPVPRRDLPAGAAGWHGGGKRRLSRRTWQRGGQAGGWRAGHGRGGGPA